MKKSIQVVMLNLFQHFLLWLTSILVLGGMAASISSCNNFLDGGDFKEQLDKDIAYAESPFYEIRLECDEGTGSFTNGAVLKKKVTDKFTIEFKISSGYRFNGWNAYSKSLDGNLTLLSEEFIKFSPHSSESSDSLFKTDVEFVKGAESIIIKPVCILLPKIESITPALESSGCDQDSSIKITFNKAVNQDSFGDFTCISITSDGEVLNGENGFFDVPQFSSDGKNIYIRALGAQDNSKLLLPPDGNATVKTISVEVNFTGNEKDADGIVLSDSKEHKYKINKNYGNLEKVSAMIQSDETYGSFASPGEKDCTVGYSLDIQFTLKKGEYSLTGFEAVSHDSGEDKSGSVTFETLETDEESGIYKVRFWINENTGNIIIRPVCVPLPSVIFTLAGTNGKFSPAKGSIRCVQTHVYSLSFEPDSDYEFIRWEIYDSKTEALIPNGTYIKIDNLKERDTSFNFVAELPENSGIVPAVRPVIAERPQILSYSPSYSPEGAWSDTTIQTVFDYDMCEDSIYFDEKEIKALKGEGVTEFLPEKPTPSKKIYGYKKDGEVFFKNIHISDKQSGRNLLQYFGSPFFEDPTTLLIPVEKAENLIAGMSIKITIDKGFFYRKDDVDICMNRSEKWLYLTNGKTDDIDPTYEISGFSVTDCTVPDGGEAAFSIDEQGDAIHSNLSTKMRSANNIKLNISELQVKDTGSNPTGNFLVVYKKVYDKDYNSIANPVERKQTVIYNTVNGTFANFTGSSELTNLEDGIYEISLEFRDRSKNKARYPAAGKSYYICVDTTPLELKTSSLEVPACSNGKTDLRFDFTTDYKDLNHTIVKVRESGSASSWDSIMGTTFARGEALSIPALTNGKKYEVCAQFFDEAGNSSQTVLERYTMPNKVQNFDMTSETELISEKVDKGSYTTTKRYYVSNATLTWKKPEGKVDSYKIDVYQKPMYSNDFNPEPVKTFELSDPNSQSCLISGLETICTYKFKITSKLEGSEDRFCEVEKTALTSPLVAYINSLKLERSWDISTTGYGLRVSLELPKVYDGSGTNDFYWGNNKPYYKFYLCWGESIEELKAESNLNKRECELKYFSPTSKYEFNDYINVPVPDYMKEIETVNGWNYDYIGLNGKVVYLALKTVYEKDDLTSIAWSDVKRFGTDATVTATVTRGNKGWDHDKWYIKFSSASFSSLIYQRASMAQDSFDDIVKYRKKGSNDTWHEPTVLSGSDERKIEVEYGGTYEIIVETIYHNYDSNRRYKVLLNSCRMEVEVISEN